MKAMAELCMRAGARTAPDIFSFEYFSNVVPWPAVGNGCTLGAYIGARFQNALISLHHEFHLPKKIRTDEDKRENELSDERNPFQKIFFR